MTPSRRELLSWLPAAFALASCARPSDSEPQPAPLLFLSDAEAAQLAAWADEVFPPDGSSLGAVRYVDRLTSDSDVFFSSLGTSVDLDRVSRAAWDVRTTALKEQLRAVLSRAVPLAQLPFDDREFICELVTQAAFARPEYGGNPDRAGWRRIGALGPDANFVTWDGEKNVERADAPVSTSEPGEDAFPLDKSTRDLLTEVARATGGRSAS
ncbi:MAG: hypothetical protein QM817_29925 [Archangium sp.]